MGRGCGGDWDADPLSLAAGVHGCRMLRQGAPSPHATVGEVQPCPDPWGHQRILPYRVEYGSTAGWDTRGWMGGHRVRHVTLLSAPTGLSAQLNTVVQLLCPHHSALATYSWQQPSSAQGHTVLLPDHTLVLIMQRGMAGTYKCQATENGYTRTVAHYQLGDGLDEEGVAQGSSGPGTQRSYRREFVTVTVLLAVTLTVAACLALLAYRDQLKARSKVRGCSTPHSPPSRHREKVPLNGGTREPSAPGAATEDEEDEGSHACCLQLDGDIDVDNNRLHVPAGDTA